MVRLTEELLQVTANGASVGKPEVCKESIAAYKALPKNTIGPEPVIVSPNFTERFNVDEYLAGERRKDMVRFSTAGSVDDGKSTLIGRLLYDTRSVYEDQLRSIEGKGTTAPGILDLALLTDGLRAEREQGITIDVAYRYFSTARRKFIIADTPGHEQYTRNMATGASTADVAVVLVDARKGVLAQSRRHAYITALLGVRHIIVAVNKMDLVDYSSDVFAEIERVFTAFFRGLKVDAVDTITLHFVPVSALKGDNVVNASHRMSWYGGPTLLEMLETIPSSQLNVDAPFRMAVQRVVRPDLDFRGFAGQISAGIVRTGDHVTALPGGRSSRVSRIVTWDGDLREAFAPMSVTLVLTDEIDISRGDILAAYGATPTITSNFNASLVWMDAIPLNTSKRYLLKHSCRAVQAFVRTVVQANDFNGAGVGYDDGLSMNGVANVTIETLQPLPVDVYSANRNTGSFVLIDLQTNATVAAGMIREAHAVGNSATANKSVTLALRGKGPLHLHGSNEAVGTAITALRSAGVLEDGL